MAMVRLLHIGAYLSAAREDAQVRRTSLSVLPGMLTGVAILFVAGFTQGLLQLGLWVLALAVDYTNVYMTSRGWRLQAPQHFAERFGFIVIIALGESIVAIGAGIGSLPMTWLVAVTAVLGLALASAMWWMYLDVVARVAEHRLGEAEGEARTKPATDSYTYLHLPLIIGIVLTALGLKKALLYVAGGAPWEALHGVSVWALTCGVGLYLTALSALRRRNLGGWNVQRLVLGLVLVAATPALELVPATVLVGIVALAAIASILFERFRFADFRRAAWQRAESHAG